jgi:nicotinate-nucleotide adenylyltransferase
MRIALFGGSFDPPHRGHLAIAQAAADSFSLDRVLFTPAGRQPLKRDGHAAAYEQRLAMCELACRALCEETGDPARFAVSTLDAPLADGSPNYTVRTLSLLADQYPRATLFNIVGADTFLEIPRWREPYRLLQLAEWIVVSRPGASLRFPEGLALTPAQRARVHLLDTVHDPVSATTLRHRLAQNVPCDDLLPSGVAAYIAEHALYRTLLQ